MAAELLKMMAGIDIRHIPYKGNNPAVTDAIGGHVHMVIVGVPATLPHVQSGRLRALAITSAKRFAARRQGGRVGEAVRRWKSSARRLRLDYCSEPPSVHGDMLRQPSNSERQR